MADFAPRRAAQEAGLAHGKGREIVVQQEGFSIALSERVDDLLVIGAAEGDRAQRLGLTPGKEGAAVDPGEGTQLTGDGPHVPRAATVDAHAVAQNALPHDLRAQGLEGGRGAGLPGGQALAALLEGFEARELHPLLAIGSCLGLDEVFADRVEGGVAGVLLGDVDGVAQLRSDLVLRPAQQRGFVRRLRALPLGSPRALTELLLAADLGEDLFVSKAERADQHVFG